MVRHDDLDLPEEWTIYRDLLIVLTRELTPQELFVDTLNAKGFELRRIKPTEGQTYADYLSDFKLIAAQGFLTSPVRFENPEVFIAVMSRVIVGVCGVNLLGPGLMYPIHVEPGYRTHGIGTCLALMGAHYLSGLSYSHAVVPCVTHDMMSITERKGLSRFTCLLPEGMSMSSEMVTNTIYPRLHSCEIQPDGTGYRVQGHRRTALKMKFEKIRRRRRGGESTSDSNCELNDNTPPPLACGDSSLGRRSSRVRKRLFKRVDDSSDSSSAGSTLSRIKNKIPRRTKNKKNSM